MLGAAHLRQPYNLVNFQAFPFKFAMPRRRKTPLDPLPQPSRSLITVGSVVESSQPQGTQSSKGDIHFYHQRAAYGFMSNFYHAPILLDGKLWPTTEHYFQAQKFKDYVDIVEQVRLCRTPSDAAALGRSRSLPLRSDWEHVKDDVMRTALKAKFEQHSNLWKDLKATQGFHLVERTGNDFYWGDGGNGKGKNMLGKLLVELREEFLKEGR